MMTSNNPALYDKKCICPHCGTAFVTKRVRSGAQPFTRRDADFCTYYKNQELNPILYTINVCPGCGYAFTDQFSTYLSPLAKKSIHENIASKWTPKDFGAVRSFTDAIVSYKLAIYAAELTGEAYSVKAGLYLRLAWLYRFLDNESEEERFLNIAINHYEQSYIHSDYAKGNKEMSEVRLLYLIGELMRRVAKYEKAISYFTKALEFRHKTIETGIITMTQDQWAITREEHKKQQDQIS